MIHLSDGFQGMECEECGESFIGSVIRAFLWSIVFMECILIYGVRG